MSLVQKNNNSKTNVFILLFFLGLFSCLMALKTNSLESFKLSLNSKFNSYSFLRSHSNSDPESLQGLLSKLIEIAKEPESEKQEKTFLLMLNKTRNLVDDMMKEQKESDVIFKKNVAILIKYIISSKNQISILNDKYDLNEKYLEYLNEISKTNGIVDVNFDSENLIMELGSYKKKLEDLDELREKFDKFTKEFYVKLDTYFINAVNSLEKYEGNILNDQVKSIYNLATNSPYKAIYFINSAFVSDINPTQEINMLKIYMDVFKNQASFSKSGTIKKELFTSIQEKVKTAHSELIGLSVKIKRSNDLLETSKKSLKSSYEEYIKTTLERNDVIGSILHILDLMNNRIKKNSINLMVYLEGVQDDFKTYVNSYEFNNIQKYISKDIKFDDLGKKLTDEYQSSKNK